MPTARTIACMLLAAVLPTAAALAQDTPVLPDLTPREVEIRGELTIRFPSLRRQPLVGFNPPPRIPDIPASRRPFAESYKQDRADLPLSPLRAPAAPSVSPYLDGPAFVGRIEAGAGRYLERFATIDVASRPDARAIWTAQGSYRGRSGFEAYPDTKAQYDQGQLQVDASIPVGSLRLGTALDGSISSYALYGVLPASGSLSMEAPMRDVRSGTVGLYLRRDRGTVRLRLEGAVGTSSVTTDAFDPDVQVDPRTDLDDHTLSADGRLEVFGGDIRPWIAARYAGTAFRNASFPQTQSYAAGGGVRFDLDGLGRLTAGAHVLGADREAGPDSSRSFTYVAPEIRLDAAVAPNIRISLSQVPRTETPRLFRIFAEQPFVVDRPALEAEIWPIDAVLRGVATFGRIEIALSAGYRQSPNRRYFEHDPETFLGYARGISGVRYGKAREVDAAADLTGYIGGSVQAGFGVTVRQGRLTDLEADLPYFAPWTLRNLVSVALLDGRALVQLITRVEGPRYRDVAQTLELPTFADFDLLTSYRISRNASVLFNVENMGGDRPEWDRYLRPSALFTVGVAWEW